MATRTEVSGLEGGGAAPSKLERVYDTLKQRILDGAYLPGHRLVLDQIAKELEVSTLPVREAIRRLEAEGFVDFQRNVGARVAPLDAGEYLHTMHVLALLDGYATAIAAPHLEPEDLAEAHQINDRLAAALGDFDPLAFTALNRDFHFVFYRRCPNQHVRTLAEEQWARLDAIRRSTFVFIPGRSRQSVAEHAALLELLEARADPAEIERAAREHKLQTLRALIASQATPTVRKAPADRADARS
jgi:DNA-binding GntR family transcriptional regulator